MLIAFNCFNTPLIKDTAEISFFRQLLMFDFRMLKEEAENPKEIIFFLSSKRASSSSIH